MKLNLGCGKSHFPDFVNIDVEASVRPDLLLNFVKEPLPFEADSVDLVMLIHVIEHIEEKYHFDMLIEINRVLKPGGIFTLAFPEFRRCASNYMENYRGKRDYWKATIFGRQLYPSDFHVSLMDTQMVRLLLAQSGFVSVDAKPEPAPNEHNTIMVAYKSKPQISREQLLKREIYGLVGE